MADEKPKRTRVRRDFARIVRDLEAYCTAAVDLLDSTTTLTEFGSGQKAAFQKILEKVSKK